MEPPGYIRRLEYIKERFFRGKKVRLAEALQVKPPYVTELLDPDHEKKNLGREKLENLSRYFREHKLPELTMEWLENGIGPGPIPRDDALLQMDAVLKQRAIENAAKGRKIHGTPRSTLFKVDPEHIQPDTLSSIAEDAIKFIRQTNNAGTLEPEIRDCRLNAINNLASVAAELLKRETSSSSSAEDDAALLDDDAEAAADEILKAQRKSEAAVPSVRKPGQPHDA